MTKILQGEDYCYACGRHIFEEIARGYMVETDEGDSFKVSLHYFPPCSTSSLPDNWHLTGKVFRYPLNYLVSEGLLFKRKPKYPNIVEQLHEIDDNMKQIPTN